MFVVIEDVSEGESEVKTERGGNKSRTGRRRTYRMVAAHLCQRKLQRGQPLRHVGPSIMETIHASTGVQLDVPGGRMKFHCKTVLLRLLLLIARSFVLRSYS